MAIVNIFGCEAGDLSEIAATSGTVAASTTQKRSGAYALRQNPTVAASFAEFGKFSADGTHASLSATTVYARASFYMASLPGSTQNLFQIYTAAGAGGSLLVAIEMNSSGVLRGGYASSYTPLGVTASSGTWYTVEMGWVSGGSSVIKVFGPSGSTTTSVNAGAGTAAYFTTGHSPTNNATYDMYVDDLCIDTASAPAAGACHILKPNASGSLAQWTNGSGTTFAEVDEVPHNSDTDYLMETGTTGTHDFNMESSATGGVGTTVYAVKLQGIVRNVAAGAGSIALWSRSAATNVTETAWATGSTSYLSLQQVKTADNAAAAWTTTTLDALQVGVVNNNANDARCTALYAMVWDGSPQSVTPSAGALTTATFAPTVSIPTSFIVTPTTASLTTSTFAPTVTASDNKSATPSILATVLATFAPTIVNPQGVTPETLATLLASFDPTVSVGQFVTPDVAALTLTTFDPTVINPMSATPGTLAAVLATFAPIASMGERLTPATLALAVALLAPTILAPRVAIPGTASLVTTPFAPAVIGGMVLTPAAAGLVVATFAPDALATAHLWLTPAPASLVIATYAPTTIATIRLGVRPPAGLARALGRPSAGWSATLGSLPPGIAVFRGGPPPGTSRPASE